jgi:plasmid stabilization system protein ParE
MTGEFEVRYTDAARDDLLRLFDFLLDRANTVEDFDAAQLAIDVITAEVEGHLARSPFIYRKVGDSPFRRELIIPFRAFGYVVLYEIEDGSNVNILAVRHQLEDDYY